jgi:hypothetical protein
VEERSDHAPNGDPWRLVSGSTFRNRRLSLREIIDLHCPLARIIYERCCCNRVGEGLVARGWLRPAEVSFLSPRATALGRILRDCVMNHHE